HAGRDRARVAGPDDQPGPPALRRSARGARGTDRAHQADRVGARWRGGRRQPGDRRGAGRVRRGGELPLPERGTRGATRGRARADFARYFFAVMLINQLTIAWDSWYLDRWIREGDLNYRLARPLHPAHEAVAENIAYKARTASVILVVWLVVAAAWPAVRLPFDPGRWAITAVAVLLAGAMRFFISFTTGLLAFLTSRATSTLW